MKFLSSVNINNEYSLPLVDGSVGQALFTDGNGNAYWGTIATSTLNDLTDVTITSVSTGQLLRYNGSTWVNWTPNFLTEESDTLHSVVLRGASTLNSISIGGLTVNGTATITGTLTVPKLEKNGAQIISSIEQENFEGEILKIVSFQHFTTEIAKIDSDGKLTAGSFVKYGGTSSQFLKADGSVDSNTYLTSYTEQDTLDSVTGRGNTTGNSISTTSSVSAASVNTDIVNASNTLTLDSAVQPDQGTTEATVSFKWLGTQIASVNNEGAITAAAFIKSGGTAAQFLKADGTVDSSTYATQTWVGQNYATIDYVDDEISGVNTYVQTNYVPKTRTITINGTAYDLSADRSWTISTADNYISNVSLAGNLLSFTGVGSGFNGSIDLSGISVNLNEVETVYERVKNVSGGPILKGTPLAVVAGQTEGFISDVVPADASDPAKMPALFIANEDIPDEAEGEAVVFGAFSGVDTSLYPSGTVVYVAAGGGWTDTKPVWPNKIQNLGVITKSHPSNGGGIVTGVGRANDIPNLTAGKIWVGSANYPIESTTVHVDEANGRLGIGTTSPGATLHIADAANSGTTSFSANGRITMRGDGVLAWGSSANQGALTWDTGKAIVLGQLGQELNLGANGATNHMVINTAGNVGIGTTSPDNKLTIRDTSNVYVDIQAATSGGAGIRMGYQNVSYAGSKIFYDVNDAVVYYDSLYPYTSGQIWGSHNFRNKDSGGTLQSRLYIAPLGNVGIGNTNPTAKLQVGAEAHGSATGIEVAAGTGGANLLAIDNANNHNWFPFTDGRNYYSAAAHTFRNATHNVDWMHINSSGNVGIGTTSPSSKLSIQNTGSSDSILMNFVMTNGSNAATFRTDDNVIFGIHSQNSGDIYIKDTSDNVLFYGKNGGNVGIGIIPASNERFSVNAAESVWALAAYRSGTLIGGIHTNDSVLQVQGNAGTEVRLSTSGNATWNGDVLATRVWVAAQGYLTSETDSQTLQWAEPEKKLTISNGNEVTITGFLTDADISSYGFITTEVDTLATVVARGNSTDSNIRVKRPANKVDNNGNPIEFGGRVEFNNDFVSGESGYMVFRYPTYNNFLIGGDYDGNIGGGIPNLQFGRSNGAVYMHIDAHGGTGNVGIGTTNPGHALDVNGNIRLQGGNRKLVFNNGSVEASLDQVTGASAGLFTTANVGIGTTAPESKLHVAGGDVLISNGQYYGVESTTGGNYKIAGLTTGNVIVVGAIDYASAGTIFAGGDNVSFTTGGVGGDTRIKIASSGNVGIGVDPVSGDKFEVAGTLRVHTGNNWDGIQIYSGGQDGYIRGLGDEIGLHIRSEYGNVFIADDRGKVAIGTTATPQKILDVNGSGIVASFGGSFGTGDFGGIHFGYSETIYGNDSYKKSALVFERTDNHGQGGNASGKIHFLLNNLSGNSATNLTHSVFTIDTDAVATQGSARVGIGTSSPQEAVHAKGNIRIDGSSTAVVLQTGDKTASGSGAVFATYDTTATYGAVVDYVVYDSDRNNMRAGTFTAVWNTNITSFNDVSTVDIGDTSTVILTSQINAADVELIVTGDAQYTIKFNVKLIK